VYEVSQDPVLQQYVGVPSPYLMEHAQYFVEHLAIGNDQRIEFVVEEAGERLARVGLGLRGDGTAEVGFWTAPAVRGRGVAPAAVLAVCRSAFETQGLDLVEWSAEIGNEASRRVAEKAGFVMEGQLRKRLVHRGQRVDAWIGSLLKGEV
jgi:RimJ/RimL family protein N-acetyltransferase